MAFPKSKIKYKLALRLSVLVNAFLLVIGLVLLINYPVEAAAKLKFVGSTPNHASYNLEMGQNDIIFVFCPSDEPNLDYLRNQKALTCPSDKLR